MNQMNQQLMSEKISKGSDQKSTTEKSDEVDKENNNNEVKE